MKILYFRRMRIGYNRFDYHYASYFIVFASIPPPSFVLFRYLTIFRSSSDVLSFPRVLMDFHMRSVVVRRILVCFAIGEKQTKMAL